MRIGRNIRDLDIPFKDEVEFSINNNFDIIQLWYSKGVLDLVYVDDYIKEIKNSNIQTIIHGSFDINDFDKYSDDYIKLLLDLNHKETIIHPVIKSEKVNKKTNDILVSNVLKLVNRLNDLGIKVYIENNHKMMKTFYTLEDWKKFWGVSPSNTEFLLDIVHVMFCDDYDFMKELVNIKYPSCIHIADTIKGLVGQKHLHIPIGKGIVDFEKIFNEILIDYDGLIIMEIKNTDKNIIDSKNKLLEILNRRK